jgi:outer membrane lipoprotein carrier protein
VIPLTGQSPPPFKSVMRLFKILAFLVAVTSAAGAGGQTPSTPSGQDSKLLAEEVAAALQRKYDSIRDFSADFVHEYEGGVLRRKRVERGTLLVKKPGKMRWSYKSPDEKLFVSDGVRLWQHFPEENRVVVSAVPQDDKVATAVLFLVGKGNLTRDFRVSFTDKGDASTWALRLDPKEPQAEYDWLEITAARDALVLRSLTVAEKQGGRSTFQFTNFKENVGLADKMFAFSPPRGAEVTYVGPSKH